MAPTTTSDASSWISNRTIQPNIRFSIPNAPFKFDKELLAKKSEKIAAILKQNPYEDLTSFFQNTKADLETIEVVARFCHGYEVHLSSNNVVQLICLSHHLRMTETHCPNNLLDKALLFLERNVMPSWDELIRSLRSLSPQILDLVIENELFNDFVSALTRHALANPSLLGHPAPNVENNSKLINATRRKLFGVDQCTSICVASEDLSCLPVRAYEAIINAMVQQQVPQEYITASLFQYLKNNQSDSEAIEAVERLLPSDTYMPTTPLLEMYAMSISQETDPGCTTGLEIRIGKHLDRITLKDLLALDLGVENLRHILKGFYGNYNVDNNTGLIAVAELMERYLIEIAKGTDLETGIFIKVAEMVTSTSNVGSYRFSDGIYRAVDVYLGKHMELSELEKEEICRVIDFDKLSKDACAHATQNRRLPLRVVVQALFNSQLQLRDEITKVVGPSCNNSNSNVEEEDGSEIKVVEDETWGDERREIIEAGHERSCCEKSGKKKGSLWKEVKRKFGCMGSNNYESLCDCNCQIKKRKKLHHK